MACSFKYSLRACRVVHSGTSSGSWEGARSVLTKLSYMCVTGFAQGLARFRRDGLLYLAPLVTCCHPQRIPRLISNCPQGDAAGTVTTKPFLLEGGQLWLNVNLSHPHAAVQIAVLDASHKELVGFGCADGSGLGHQRNAALEVQYLWHRSLHKLRNQVGHRAAHRVAARSIRLY